MICEANTDPDFKLFEIDTEESAAARAKIPNLQHAREFNLSTVIAK